MRKSNFSRRWVVQNNCNTASYALVLLNIIRSCKVFDPMFELNKFLNVFTI